jgi:hypothetical protein
MCSCFLHLTTQYAPILSCLLHNLDKQVSTLRSRIFGLVTLTKSTAHHLRFAHTFSRSLLIHWTMLSPWSARSSTSNVWAHSLRLGSPSSLIMYKVGKTMEPTPLDLWSLDFSTTVQVSMLRSELKMRFDLPARTRSEYSLSKTGRDAFPCLSCVRSSTPKTSAKSAGTASRPIHLESLASFIFASHRKLT